MRRLWLLVAVAVLAGAGTAGAGSASATSSGRLTIAFPDERQPAPGPATDPLDGPTQVVTLNDGGLIVVGKSNGHIVLAELRPDGALDDSFGQAGVATVTLPLPDGNLAHGYVDGVLRQPDGKLLIVIPGRGAGRDALVPEAVVRLDADGSLDTSFGTGGVAQPAGFGAECAFQAPCAALQPDGDIVIAGGVPGARAHPVNAALAELTPAGAAAASFGHASVATLPVEGPADLVADAPDGQIVAKADAVVLRVDADGEVDRRYGGGQPVALPCMAVCHVLPSADGSLLVVNNLNDRPHRPQGAESIFRYDEPGRRDRSYGPAQVPLRLHEDPTLLAAPGGGAVALDLTAPFS